MAKISSFPPEILLQIFRLYLETETQFDLINCVGKVCRNWQELCKDPSLWQEFDGTLSFEVLKEYCKQGILKKCKILVFSGISDNPNPKDIEQVYESLPQLNCVNFSRVISVKNKIFLGKLICKCPELQKIVFNNNVRSFEVNPRRIEFPFYGCKLLDFLMVRGASLVSLDFSNLYFLPSEDLFLTISNSCPNLEILKVENLEDESFLSFPTVHMQSNCPKLKVLCLGYPICIDNQAHVVGFKNMEIFRHPSPMNHLFPRCPVDAVIFESKKLKKLDISNCVFAKSNCLHPLNYSLLESLNISSGIVYDLACFTEVIQKWSNSLKVLDVSNVTDVSLNDVFKSVISGGGLRNLTSLNLKGTSVTIPIVKLIVKNCAQLHVLNLEFCSELEEFSSMYESHTAMIMLCSKLIAYGY